MVMMSLKKLYNLIPIESYSKNSKNCKKQSVFVFQSKYKAVTLDLRAHIANSHMINMGMLSHN